MQPAAGTIVYIFIILLRYQGTGARCNWFFYVSFYRLNDTFANILYFCRKLGVDIFFKGLIGICESVTGCKMLCKTLYDFVLK